jgi:hypothetical protein
MPALPHLENVVYIHTTMRGANYERLSKEYSAITHFVPNAPGDEGVQWSLAGTPSDFAQRLRGKMFDAADVTNQPPAGTLLSNARQAGLSTGEFGPTVPDALPAVLPRLSIVRLAGPDADRALGPIVDALSKQPTWSKTAVFVVSDGAPLVISAYSRQPAPITGMFFNHSSILRTMEIILKLRPMTVFDASARPLTEVLTPKP